MACGAPGCVGRGVGAVGRAITTRAGAWNPPTAWPGGEREDEGLRGAATCPPQLPTSAVGQGGVGQPCATGRPPACCGAAPWGTPQLWGRTVGQHHGAALPVAAEAAAATACWVIWWATACRNSGGSGGSCRGAPPWGGWKEGGLRPCPTAPRNTPRPPPKPLSNPQNHPLPPNSTEVPPQWSPVPLPPPKSPPTPPSPTPPAQIPLQVPPTSLSAHPAPHQPPQIPPPEPPHNSPMPKPCPGGPAAPPAACEPESVGGNDTHTMRGDQSSRPRCPGGGLGVLGSPGLTLDVHVHHDNRFHCLVRDADDTRGPRLCPGGARRLGGARRGRQPLRRIPGCCWGGGRGARGALSRAGGRGGPRPVPSHRHCGAYIDLGGGGVRGGQGGVPGHLGPPNTLG